jgi:hypothetical protein
MSLTSAIWSSCTPRPPALARTSAPPS